MPKATPVNMKINIRDFYRIEKRIAQLQAELAADADLTQEEKDAKFESALNHYTGLVWDDATGKVSVAPGFHADAEGNIVK